MSEKLAQLKKKGSNNSLTFSVYRITSSSQTISYTPQGTELYIIGTRGGANTTFTITQGGVQLYSITLTNSATPANDKINVTKGVACSVSVTCGNISIIPVLVLGS